MKRFMLTVALTCVLSVSALAGEMPTCGTAASGDISSPGIAPPVPGETQTPPGETSSPPGNTQGPTLLETVILTILTWPR